MSKKILVLREKLRAINREYADDEEGAHSKFDKALLKFIGDKEVTGLYHAMARWCA